MQEIKYREITVPAEDGRLLALSYHILTDTSQTPARYGVKVAERISGETAQAADLTTDARRIYDLAHQLAAHTVTPTTLPDVVADWL